MIIEKLNVTYLSDGDFMHRMMPDTIEEVNIYLFKYPIKESFNRSGVVIYSGKLGRKLIKSRY